MIDPSSIIHDVQREYKEEELKENLIKKNLEISSDSDEIKRTMRKRKFAQAKNKRRVNWIIKLSAKHHKMLTSKERAFLMWRSYGINDNINVIKYYQCHGYGHIAKFCNLQKYLCSLWGSNKHLGGHCRKKNNPECINCIMGKRNEMCHEVHNKNCTEFRRHLELYQSCIKW